MAVQPRVTTLAEFQHFRDLPENSDKIFELIDGEIVQKVPSFTPSRIAIRIARLISEYVDEQGIGYVTGADGGYIMSDARVFNPDVAFISKTRLPEEPEREAPVAPDFAVEIKSPTDAKPKMRAKALKYLDSGTRIVWLVYPDEQQVEVYTADHREAVIFAVDDTLTGSDVLPGFTLTVKSIFVM